MCGCWVGGEDRSIHFNAMREGQGAKAALPIIGILLKKIFADTISDYSKFKQFIVPKQFRDSCIFQNLDNQDSVQDTVVNITNAY